MQIMEITVEVMQSDSYRTADEIIITIVLLEYNSHTNRTKCPGLDRV